MKTVAIVAAVSALLVTMFVAVGSAAAGPICPAGKPRCSDPNTF